MTQTTTTGARAHTVTGAWEVARMATFRHGKGWHMAFGDPETLPATMTLDDVIADSVAWARGRTSLPVDSVEVRIVWADPTGAVETTTVEVTL